MDISDEDLAELLNVEVEAWLGELPQLRKHYARFGDHLPQALARELDELQNRLEAAR